MATQDREVLIAEFRRLLGNQLTELACSFYLEMNNWSVSSLTLIAERRRTYAVVDHIVRVGAQGKIWVRFRDRVSVRVRDRVRVRVRLSSCGALQHVCPAALCNKC